MRTTWPPSHHLILNRLYSSEYIILHSVKLEHRQLLGKNILRVRKGIIKAVQYHKSNNHSPRSLQNNIISSVDHVFGEHSKCDSYFSVNLKNPTIWKKKWNL